MMHYSVISVSEANRQVWESNLAFSNSYGIYQPKVVLIESLRDRQIPESSSITSDKNNKKLMLCGKIVFIEHRLKSFAKATGNSRLAEGQVYCLSTLINMPQAELPAVANAVLKDAIENIHDLEPFGVNMDMIDDFRNTIADYNSALPKPRSAKDDKKTATLSLKKAFNEADDILKNRLDLDIELFKTSAPEFYNAYMNARRIHVYGHRVIAFKAIAINAETGEGLNNVIFSILDADGNKVVAVKKTSPKGNFVIKNLAEGEYTVRIHKTGYKEQTVKLCITGSETSNLKVVMEAA
jgi:hypothetical protein